MAGKKGASGGARQNSGRAKVKDAVVLTSKVTKSELSKVKAFIKSVNVYEK
jgi:hypothetical protein